MVSDVAARRVYQVAITSNGACLKGTVILAMKLPETSEPFGLARDDSQLYVADSSREGRITKLNLATLESDKLVRNGSEDCHTVHGFAVTKERHLVFTDRGSRTVQLQLSQQDTRIEIQTIAGSGVAASKDGSCLSACFSQPTAVCIEGRTLFVADTAVGAIKMITPTNSLCEFLGQLDLLCKSFGIHLKGVQGEVHAIDEAVTSLNTISLSCDAWVKEVQDKMGRNISIQGPEGTISSKSCRSLEILKDSLTSLGNHVSLVSPDYHKVLLLASTLTLVVENFFSKIRSRNDMPTVLEFAHLFAPTIRESLKQLTDTGFAYHTSSSAHYEAPDEMKLSFRNLPTIPSMPSVSMAKEQKKLRNWRDSYGRPVRQLTVGNQSTKDNVGTLPLYACTAPDPAARLVDFSVIVQDTAKRR